MARLEFEDDLLRPLSIASRAELFLNRVPLDTTGQFARFPGGFLIADIADPTVTAGFSPLFPVLTALGHAVGVAARGARRRAPLRDPEPWLACGASRGGWAACMPPGSRPRSRPSRCRRSGSRSSRCQRRSRSVS